MPPQTFWTTSKNRQKHLSQSSRKQTKNCNKRAFAESRKRLFKLLGSPGALAGPNPSPLPTWHVAGYSPHLQPWSWLQREQSDFLVSSPSFGDLNRRKKSLSSLLDNGFSAPGENEYKLRERRDTDSLELEHNEEEEHSEGGLQNGVSGGTEFDSTASNQNEFGSSSSGQNEFVEEAVNNGITGSAPADRETGGTTIRTSDNALGDLSGNWGFGFGSAGQRGFGSSGSGWSGMSSSGLDASGSGDLSQRTGSSTLGDKSGNWGFGFGKIGQKGFGSSVSGWSDINSNGLDASGSDGSSARNMAEYSGCVSENSGFNLESFDQKGFGVIGTGWNRKTKVESSGAEYLSPGSDVSGSDKGSHIPEATPKYSETNEIVGEVSTWGKGAYKAFNGYIFSFESACTYTFCRHCVESGGDFNIEIKRNNDSDVEKITVIIDSNEVSIFGDIILVNGESAQIPYNNKLIHIKKYGEYNFLNSRRGILSLMWDKNNKVSLTLHKQYSTCGLCGNFNSTPGEDSKDNIANSKIPGDCPKAVSKRYEVCDDGKQYCNKIIGTYFERCGKVAALSSDYKKICIDEYCQSGDEKSTCDTFSELSRLCASDGPGNYESWRNDSDVVCEKRTCPGKQIYKECGPSNPVTCFNLIPFQDSECVSGCVCPEGYLLDDIGEKGQCVLKDDCPCESNGKVYQPGEVREGPCGSQCTCQEAKWSCTEALCPGRCKVEGSSFTTFDGVKYNHPGNCHFLAIHDEDWSVSVELRPCPNGQAGTCLNSVTLLLNSSVSVDKYIFNRDGTVTNDKIRNQGNYYPEVQIFNASSLYLQVETYFHVKMQIQIHPTMQLYVSMPPNQFTDTVGLCGSYNNKAEDDFMSSQNILEKTSQAFANSWQMMPCPKGNPASCISIEKEKYAEKHCAILLDSHGPFASCHPIVNPKSYLEECKKYTCTCEKSQDCLCTMLGNYVKACAEKETYIMGWRTGLCEHSCPSGLVFKYNVKACNSSCRSLSERDRSCDVEDVPVDGCTCPDGMYHNNEGKCVQKSKCDCYLNDEVMQAGKVIHIDNNKCVCQDGILLCQIPIDLTLQNCSGGAEYVDCSDPKAQRRTDRTCNTRNIPNFDEDSSCKRGCYCPVGMVRNSKGKCVFPDDCPCSFGGREYEQGSVTSVGCNECMCVNGSWECTQNECQTTCHIYGEGHVRTFDGKSYSFDGLCQYSFLEDYCGSENGTFHILTESVPCCEDGLTCSRKVIVAFQDQNVVLQDGKVTAVKTTESKECELNVNAYSIHTIGLYLILKFINGITLIWDKNTRVSVILDPRWNGKVCGLCGNNNGDLKDDFTTRYSSVAAGTLEFGNSWKTSQECSDTVDQTFPCDSNPYCKAWAVRKCEIIRDSTFRDCHNKVDPNAYYDACIEEACACDMEGKYLGFCTAVAMYAEACSAVGVCVPWRKPNLCPVYCDYYNEPGEYSWHYEPCGTVTAKTCKDQVLGQKFSALLEGCYAKCPDSAPYLDENTMKCVNLSECSCFYNDIIPAGGIIEDNCGRTCYCIAGELKCSASTTRATSTLSTKAAITLVTSSSGTAVSIPAITTSSSETIGTTGISARTSAVTTGISGVSVTTEKLSGTTPGAGGGSTPGDLGTGATSPGTSGTSERPEAATTGIAAENTPGVPATAPGTARPSSGPAGTSGTAAAAAGTTRPAPGESAAPGTTAAAPGTTRPAAGQTGTPGTAAAGPATTTTAPGEPVTAGQPATAPGTARPSSGPAGTSGTAAAAAGTTRPAPGESAAPGTTAAAPGTTRPAAGQTGTPGTAAAGPATTTTAPGEPVTAGQPATAPGTARPSSGPAGTSGTAAAAAGTTRPAPGESAAPGTTAAAPGTTRPAAGQTGTPGTAAAGPATTTTAPGEPVTAGQPATAPGTARPSSGPAGTSGTAAAAAGTTRPAPGESAAPGTTAAAPGTTRPAAGQTGTPGTAAAGPATTTTAPGEPVTAGQPATAPGTARPSSGPAGTSGTAAAAAGTTRPAPGESAAPGTTAAAPGTTRPAAGQTGTPGTAAAGPATTTTAPGEPVTAGQPATAPGTARPSSGPAGTSGTAAAAAGTTRP
ncbi:mucin-19-like, partial [Choloepus didactylus]|uniref:mucin-19-like n=1 Tax=Choloepus didactylus TaxID=27675 RepID=UPI00189C91D6